MPLVVSAVAAGGPAHAPHREAWVFVQTQNLTLPPLPTQMKDSRFLPHSLASGSVSIKALELNASCSQLLMAVSSFLARTRSDQDGGVLGWHDGYSMSWSGCRGCHEVGHHPQDI